MRRHEQESFDTSLATRAFLLLRRALSRPAGLRGPVDLLPGTASNLRELDPARSNRREEHIAIALVNLDQRWSFDGLGEFAFLDYQLPLKAKRSDIGIGKVDLLGLARQGQLLVVELKVTGHTGGRSDPPIVALLEGLRYAAILVANLARLSEEVRLATGSTLSEHAAPDVVVLGERSWWQTWRNVKDGSAALSALGRFADGIRGQLGLALHFAEMADVSLTYGRDGAAPQLDTAPDFRRVEFP